MSYEYNPNSKRFDVPNPHRVENAFLIGTGAFCIVAALTALLAGRSALENSMQPGALRPIVIAIGLLGFGIGTLAFALRQLRFFFGRGQPVGLVNEIGQENEGVTAAAEGLRETLRQGAISYPIRKGAIANLLYALARNLVFSPPRVQDIAVAEFYRALCAGLLLLSFGLAMLTTAPGAARDLLAALYFLLLLVEVLEPMRGGRSISRPPSQRLVIVLIIIAVISPVLVPQLVGNRSSPLAPYLQLPVVALVVLAAALLAALLVLTAALAQQVAPNVISMAQTLKTLSMNAPPNQIFVEFDRAMQRDWTDQIPNRCYLKQSPRTVGNSGSFDGQAIQETQPVPQDLEPMTAARCFASPTYRWLLLLDVYAAAITCTGAGMLADFALRSFDYGALSMGLSLLLIGGFAFYGGNGLWRRFEFTSRIYWLECLGNFQLANTQIGSFLNDRLKTDKHIVNVEDMTLRVWAAEIDSVCFGPGEPRWLVSIRGRPDESERLASHLAEFGSEQSAVVMPQSQRDLQRLTSLGKLNAVAQKAELLVPPEVAAAFAATPAKAAESMPDRSTAAASAPTAAKFCPGCGAKNDGSNFCPQCGHRLSAP